jgi:hypothetical protein
LADAGVTLSTTIASTAAIYALVAGMLFVVAKTLAPRDAVGGVEDTSP